MNEITAVAVTLPPIQKASNDRARLSPAGGETATTKKLPQPKNAA